MGQIAGAGTASTAGPLSSLARWADMGTSPERNPATEWVRLDDLFPKVATEILNPIMVIVRGFRSRAQGDLDRLVDDVERVQ
jgi:hypothetical protein